MLFSEQLLSKYCNVEYEADIFHFLTCSNAEMVKQYDQVLDKLYTLLEKFDWKDDIKELLLRVLVGDKSYAPLN